jgi:hypothetical protein
LLRVIVQHLVFISEVLQYPDRREVRGRGRGEKGREREG